MKHARKTKLKASLGVAAKIARKDRAHPGWAATKGAGRILRRAAAGAIIGGKAAGGVGAVGGFNLGLASGMSREMRRMSVTGAHESRRKAAQARAAGNHHAAAFYSTWARREIKEGRKAWQPTGIEKMAGAAVRGVKRLVKRIIKRSDGHKQAYYTKSTSCAGSKRMVKR